MVRTQSIHVPPGTRYGKWTVDRELTADHRGLRRFLCKCTCGRESPVHLQNLRSGMTKGCRYCCTTRGSSGKWSEERLAESRLQRKLEEEMLKEAGII